MTPDHSSSIHVVDDSSKELSPILVGYRSSRPPATSIIMTGTGDGKAAEATGGKAAVVVSPTTTSTNAQSDLGRVTSV